MSRFSARVTLERGLFPYVLYKGGQVSGDALEEGVWHREPPAEGEAVIPLPEFLAGRLAEKGVSRVILELPLELAVFHILELPPMKTPDAKKAIPFELERKLPISLDNFCWTYSLLASNPSGVKALAVGVLRSVLVPYLEMIRAREIEVVSVEFVTFRFLARQPVPQEALCLGLGAECVDLCLVRDGVPVLAWGLDVPSDGSRLPEFLASIVGREAATHGVSQVALFGLVEGRGLDRLAGMLPNLKLEYPAGTKPGALGSKTPAGPYRLNVLPDEYRKKINPHPAILTALVVLLAVSFYFQLTIRPNRDREALARVTQELESLRASAESASGSLREREDVTKKLRAFRPFFAESNRPFVALQELSGLLPSDAWLVNFNMDEKGKVEIEGFSARSSDLLSLLEDSPRFSKVEMFGPVIVQPEGERFAIRMIWESETP